MAIRKILEIPNPLLKKTSTAIEKITPEITTLLDDMLETMYAAPGIGLAAPQVGILKRVVVVDISRENEAKKTPYKMINPKIIEHGEETDICDEGCLSVPEQYAPVERFQEITVSYQDERGEEKTLKASGLLAVAIQHEIDHLNGKLFIDYLSKMKKDMLIRRLEKERRWKADLKEEG